MILFVDRNDSFSANLHLSLRESIFEKSQQDLEENSALHPMLVRQELDNLSSFDFNFIVDKKISGIVLSSGPGFPGQNKSILHLLEKLMKHESQIPVFGVCLGFQEMLVQTGFEVKKQKTLQHHGKQEDFSKLTSHILKREWTNFSAIFYNSLSHFVEQSITQKAPLKFHDVWKNVVVNSQGMTCFAEHATLNWIGTQFHPESVFTPLGQSLTNAFVKFCFEKDISQT